MKFIQITDLHIDDTTEDTRGVDVRSNFIKLLNKIQEEDYDHLVVSGDLCLKEGRLATYHWIKERLDNLGKEYSIISGNHDSNQMIREVFGQNSVGAEKIYYSMRLDCDHVFFLDTSDGMLCSEQMNWLNKVYNRSTDRIIVFMHHPPAYCDVPFMDEKHQMKNWEETLAFFERFEVPVYVFCGHYHVDKYVNARNTHVFLTPSNYFQMGQTMSTFELDHYNIGYRIINLDQQHIRTNVKYVYLQ